MELTLETDYGLQLNVERTVMVEVPSQEAMGRDGLQTFGASPLVAIAAPEAMLEAVRERQGSGMKLGCLTIGACTVGVWCCYAQGHLAAAMFDLAEPAAREMARVAIAEGHARSLLVSSDAAVMTGAKLEEDVARILRRAPTSAVASFATYGAAAGSVARELTQAATLERMGLDARLVRSVTLSMCAPSVNLEALAQRDAVLH